MNNPVIPSDAHGFLLLTLPQVTVYQLNQGQNRKLTQGELQIECLALPRSATANLTTPGGQTIRPNPFSDNPAPNQDLYLILKASEFELCLLPVMRVTRTPSFQAVLTAPINEIVFRVPSPALASSFVDIVIPTPRSEEDQEDLETFEILLKQYGCLDMPTHLVNREIGGIGLIEDTPLAAPPTSRPGMTHSKSGGRFVLVNEANGQVIGELDQGLQVDEGEKVLGGAKDEPVVVDFGVLESGYTSGVVTVKTVDEADMDDWLMKGAHYLSQGILGLGKGYSSGVTSAAEYYTKKVTPRAEPVKMGANTKEGIRQVHNVSAKGLKVTKKTLGVVTDALGGIVGKATAAGMAEYDDFKKANSPGSSTPATPTSANGKKQKSIWLRAFNAAEVVASSLEVTTSNLVTSTTDAASTAAGHKYGPEAGQAARILGGSVHNVALVYVDVRGVARKTIVKSGKQGVKGVIKTRLENGQVVILESDGEKMSSDLTVVVEQENPPPPAYSTQPAAPRADLNSRLSGVAKR